MVPVALSLQSRSGLSDRKGEKTGFFDRVVKLVERIEYRRANTDQEREAIFRLRYEAYRRENAISPNVSGRFSDRYDDADNAYLFGLYIEGELASSLRLHVVSKEHPRSPSLEAFADILQPELDAGKVVIDPNRFVADETFSRLHSGLPYATLRLCPMAAEFFSADLLLAAVRPEHQAFYRRVFRHRTVCAPRSYPGLAKQLSLMTIHYPTVGEKVYRRYPFFRTTVSEQRLFERPGSPTSSHREVVDAGEPIRSEGTSRPVELGSACVAGQ